MQQSVSGGGAWQSVALGTKDGADSITKIDEPDSTKVRTREESSVVNRSFNAGRKTDAIQLSSVRIELYGT